MTTRNLDALFNPRSIALVGASNQPGTLGSVLARNLLESGFEGPILPVNPHAALIRSAMAYRSIAALPLAPDLAVIATPAASVPQVVTELGLRGCRAAVVISAGFNGVEGARLRQTMLEAARPHLLRLLGPNCLGFISPSNGLNASFAHLMPAKGNVALVAQSGAITTAALDWASGRGFGFSRVATLGDMADVDFGDMLDYLALDPETHAILLYVESITDARKFMTAARIAARAKPVVVIKAGRSAAGAKAAFSHTGALAGSDRVYDAAFRRAGLLRVKDLRELFDAVAILTAGIAVKGDRLAIMTNGGGAGVLATDALEDLGGRLAILEPSTIAALNGVLPSLWSRANPIDIIGDATADRYEEAIEPLLQDKAADAILVMSCPTAMTDSGACASAIIGAVARHPNASPVLTCWLGGPAAVEPRRRFSEAGLPSHETPDEAVRGFMHLVDHARNRQLLLEAPPAGPVAPEKARARTIIAAALADNRLALSEPEAKAILAAYGIPVLDSLTAATPEAAQAAAETLTAPFALKILSPDITHKSDVGGVALSLASGIAVCAAAETMRSTVAAKRPDARIDGYIVQSMVVRPHAHELIVGVSQDPTFGSVILFGQGGVAVEALADRAVGLPPLNRSLAKDMIARTRIATLLKGYRDVPAVDLDAVADVLERLAMLALDHPEIGDLDINPLLADEAGVLALDARIKLTATPVRSAICPYPADLVRQAQLADGTAVIIRPIRPSDEGALVSLIQNSTAEDVRLRFRGAAGPEPHAWAARLSQLDFDREMALVAENGDDIVGAARIAADPEGATAEFALLVGSDWQNRGVGTLLLNALLAFATDRGLNEIWGEVAAKNGRMLGLSSTLGFTRGAGSDPSVVRITKRLQDRTAAHQ